MLPGLVRDPAARDIMPKAQNQYVGAAHRRIINEIQWRMFFSGNAGNAQSNDVVADS